MKNGNTLLAILVTGKIIAKKASVFNSTKTEINMKACGVVINDMDRVPTGETKMVN